MITVAISSRTRVDVSACYDAKTKEWTLSGYRQWDGSQTKEADWVEINVTGPQLHECLDEFAARYKKARRPRPL